MKNQQTHFWHDDVQEGTEVGGAVDKVREVREVREVRQLRRVSDDVAGNRELSKVTKVRKG